jgi:hypothetical protein
LSSSGQGFRPIIDLLRPHSSSSFFKGLFRFLDTLLYMVICGIWWIVV